MIDKPTMTVTMNSKTDCPYCDQARDLLTANKIPFTEVKWDDTEKRQRLYDTLRLSDPSERSVPQIMVHDGHEYFRIGGAKRLAYEMAGLLSLFGLTTAVRIHALEPSRPVLDAAGMVEAEEGHSCCE